MKTICVSAPAERDLDQIWYYVARKSGSIDIANNLIDSITQTFALFSRDPKAGTRCDEIDLGLRCFPVKSHIIYYRPTPVRPHRARYSRNAQSRDGISRRVISTEAADGARGFTIDALLDFDDGLDQSLALV